MIPIEIMMQQMIAAKITLIVCLEQQQLPKYPKRCI